MLWYNESENITLQNCILVCKQSPLVVLKMAKLCSEAGFVVTLVLVHLITRRNLSTHCRWKVYKKFAGFH